MALKKKPQRINRPSPVSFRISEHSFTQLRTLCLIYNLSQTEALEQLLNEADKAAKKESASNYKEASQEVEREIKKVKKSKGAGKAKKSK